MSEPGAPRDPFQLSGVTIEGKYRIAAPVGDGGFGVVYRGVHKGFGELIAIKCLRVPAALGDREREELLDRLKDEGRMLHRLSRMTSGIVQALDVGAFITPAGVWVPYLVLEWLEGETLADHAKARGDRGEGGMSPEAARELLEPAARALAVAHAQKVAHRDVKPANLFVTEVGGARTVKVLDFGIAKVLGDHASLTAALEATSAGPSAFTPRYGAPEQFQKQRGASGPWTDVFALALVFVELVSGRKALEGDDPTELYITSADPTTRPTLRARGASASDAVERVLARALAVEPKQRYADAGAFWDALTAAIAAAPPGATAREPASGPVSEGHGLLTTAEFAAARKLDVPLDEEQANAATDTGGLGPTLPFESLRERPAVAADTPASGTEQPLAEAASWGATVTTGPPGSPALRSGAASRASGTPVLATRDPMAETPPPQRVTPPSGSPPRSEKPREPTAAGEKPAGPPAAGGTGTAPRSRSRAPWIVLALALAGGTAALAYGTGNRGEAAKPTPKPAASASAAAPRPSASIALAPVASASAPPPASASAGPATPPEDMVYIAPGGFRGDPASPPTIVSRGFFLDRTEVTVRAYRECITKRKCSVADHVALTPEPGPGAPDASAAPPGNDAFADAWTRRCNDPRGAEKDPINCVDFTNAEGYCRFRGRRLPTEAEWELAARGAGTQAYPWGDEAPDCARACFDRNGACVARGEAVATCPAASHPGDRTASGVFDLAGNVGEWVADGFASPQRGGIDPRGDPGSLLRVVRGGSFLDGTEKLTVSARMPAAPVTAYVAIGFRCAMDAPAPSAARP